MELQDKVQDLLDRVVEQGLECGCQAAVYIDGKLEVNAYAGWTDWSKSRPVDENTLFPVYSTGKAPCSTSFHRLVEDGLVDYDTEVREFWPEFACNGKESMTVRHILSYRGGLYIQPKSTLKELADFKLMTERMAMAAPAHKIGEFQRYHPMTYGWLVAGMICHLLNDFDYPAIFRKLVGKPAKMDHFHYGATLQELENSAMMVPSQDGRFYDRDGLDFLNTLEARTCCNPASCAMSNALSIANHYHALDQGMLLAPETIANATQPCRDANDPFEFKAGNWVLFGLGYMLSGPKSDPGQIFGHGGWSGAEGLLDRKKHMAIGLTRNLFADPNAARDNALFKALGFSQRDW